MERGEGRGQSFLQIFLSKNMFVIFHLNPALTPELLASNFVYSFSSLSDTNLTYTYIGKTKLHLVVRSLEHLEFKEVRAQIGN